MSKKKFSFSVFFAVFLVLMLSTAAFAYGTFKESISNDGSGGINFKFTNVMDTSKDFTVKVYSSTDNYATEVVGSSKDFTTASGATSTYNLPSSSITLDKNGNSPIYKFALYYKADTTTIVGLKYGAITNSANTAMANEKNPTKTVNGVTVTLLNTTGSGLSNANHTGMNGNDATRNRTQKTHGFYQNNTNSCAGCHQTHTGADSNLLFKDGIYSTCSACHDGTTGAYNSFAPATEENAHSLAGTFNVTSANNGSIHEADGSLNISAAPGGNRTATTGGFSQEFDCASCHAPHGNGANANNLNIDPMGWGTVAYGATGDAQNGKLFKDITIVPDESAVPTTQTTPYILVKRHFADQNALDTLPANQKYYYNRDGITTIPAGGLDILQTYKWGYANHVKGYAPDFGALWLREIKDWGVAANTTLQHDDGSVVTDVSDLTVIWKDGFAYGTGVANVNKAQVSVGVDVDTTDEIATLYDENDPNYVPDSGKAMSEYCAACHVDYLSYTRKDVTGKYVTAHRHQTDADETTCVRCHFAHGSDAQIMKDANDNTYYDLTLTLGATNTVDGKTGLGITPADALSYLKDPNPSSALKRYTGMSVCYACHGKGEQFLGNPNTAQKDGFTHQYLQDGQPGTTRTDVLYNNN